ncbi:MAG TPA: MBL fold metallo-hydrolase [Thermoanaerobaculaceae bacterium]|nr:MBL fold metallo-hydrolase [Thermoanaerobaculaceae bacterium]HRS15370.1 MBL fold metallo-hydrolase [Thermoanaerobaculaceae bacterium]
MRALVVAGLALAVIGVASAVAFEKDVLETSAGDLEITFIGHGSLILSFGGRTIHVDPFGKLADYASLPKADLVLITHGHGDHLDPAALAAVRTEKTVVVASPVCEGRIEGAIVMRNGETRELLGLPIFAVPAYNLVHVRKDGQPFHPRGEGNGYVVTFGDTRVLIAGDTENVPELKALQGIAVAFLPMNLPYTMTPEMVADLARALKPKILYPYHFGDTDTARIVALLEDTPALEVRIRPMS